MLQKHLPAPWAGLIEQANELMQQQNFSDAMPLLLQAYQESDKQSEIGVGLAQVYLHLNRCDEAEAILDTIPMADQDALYEQARAQLQLKREAAVSPELKALEEKHTADPTDLMTAYLLSIQYSQNARVKDALDLLMTVLRKDLGFEEGAAKKAFMDIIASLGKGDPLAAEYQRKIYTLLY